MNRSIYVGSCSFVVRVEAGAGRGTGTNTTIRVVYAHIITCHEKIRASEKEKRK